MPLYVNPAEFLLDLTSSDFARGDNDAQVRIEKLQSDWRASPEAEAVSRGTSSPETEKEDPGLFTESSARSGFVTVVIALLHRSFIKSYRDVVAYGIRFAMYIGAFLCRHVKSTC